MAKSRYSKWIKFEDVPEGVKHYLRAYHEAVDALHHTNNVVRVMEESPVRVFVQTYGRVTAGQLCDLEQRAGCRVEIEGRAKNYTLIMMFGDHPSSSETHIPYHSEPCNFLYREL